MQQQQSFVIGVDLGGTKIAIGAVTPDLKLLHAFHIPTFDGNRPLENRRDRDLFLEKMANAISNLVLRYEDQGAHFLGKVGFGSPGNILNGVIKAHTTPQLGPAMDDFNIEVGMADVLKKKLPHHHELCVVVKNDALAQMAYSIADLMKEDRYKKSLDGKRVSYVGPGTGLGGGFAKISLHGERVALDFFTDGHIGDIIMHRLPDGTPVWAEFNYLSGIYIAKRTNGLTGKDLALNLEQHRPFVKELGINLGKIIEKIYQGDVYKARATTMWSDQDREAVKGIHFYIIGGSIGTRGEMGQIIRDEALAYLQKQLGVLSPPIEIIPVLSDSADAGILGAAQFVLSLE